MKATRGCYLVAEASSAGRQLRLSRSCSQLLMPTTSSTSRRATSNTRFARLPALLQRNLCLDSRRKLVSLRATEESRQQASAGVGEGEEAEVEELVGVRLVRDKETGRPYVEYLVKWQVSSFFVRSFIHSFFSLSLSLKVSLSNISIFCFCFPAGRVRRQLGGSGRPFRGPSSRL